MRGAGELVSVVAGDDWSLPAWVQPAPDSGFFSEEVSPAHQVNLRVVDLTWRQLKPTESSFSTTGTDSVYGMSFPSWDTQLAGNEPFWLRIWISGTNWAPAWARSACGVSTVGTGYENDPHLPIWNACLWQKATAMLREVLIDRGLRADPRMRLMYVPGAFTWCEFDFDIPEIAAQNGDLTFAQFSAWYQGALSDLVAIANGENGDPSDDFAWKLVHTGEDYPFSSWGSADDLLARDAVAAGTGIRTGITEVFNFHLAEIPAYGTTIDPSGFLVTDESWDAFFRGRVRASENECYDACGFSVPAGLRFYAIKMSNLKALQMRLNRLYVVPGDSYLDAYPGHWNWVRRSLGQSVYTSADAWAALREAQDTYWLDDDSKDWAGKPWIRNLERWLTQRDVPGSMSRRGSESFTGVLDPSNGTAWEGRRTHRSAGQEGLALFVDDRFLPPGRSFFVDLKITFRDGGSGSWRVTYPSAAGTVHSDPVTLTGDGTWKTATLRLDAALWNGSLAHGADLRLVALGPADLEVRLVRLVKRQADSVLFLDGLENGTSLFWNPRLVP
ncbi:MAG: hypothetical protein F9K16_09940 [Thermoanaerobaculia bacterium]|nr:MAG: hypothetical protein F9K16_09940 [Thermoanaerobaculia bacterium]MBZ0103881.1 hypothetical protein [Thermoanaerobaculia bacterium]